MLKLFSYSKCSTCRKAIKWLQDNQIDYDLIDIVEPPPKKELLEEAYGHGARECPSPDGHMKLVFSRSKSFDLVELEQLLQSVGWSHRPARKVRRALDNSLLKIGLWKHDPKLPRLIGFARCSSSRRLR